QLRLAARQGTQQAAPPAQIAAGPSAEPQQNRTAPAVRKATTIAHTDMPPVRRVNATQVSNPFAQFDVGTRALAYDEQRPRERGFAYRSAPSHGLFGTLY